MADKIYTVHSFMGRFIAFFALFCLAFYGAVWYISHLRSAELQAKQLLAYARQLDERSISLDYLFKSLPREMALLAKDHEFKDISFVDDQRLSESAAFKEIAAALKALQAYQIRLIDTDGLERLRVQLIDGDIVISAKDQLEDLSQSDLFKKGITLPKNSVHISPIITGVPFSPTNRSNEPVLSATSPLHGYDDSSLQGLLVLDYALSDLLTDKYEKSLDPGFYLLIDANGINTHTLFGSTSSTAATDLSFRTKYTDVWNEMQQSDKGQLIQDNVAWSFKRVTPWTFQATKGASAIFPANENRQPASGEYYYLASKRFLNSAPVEMSLLTGALFFLLLIGYGLWKLLAYKSSTVHKEAELHRVNQDLESRVAQRTAELEQSNIDLQLQIEETERSKAENAELQKMFIQAQKMEAMGTLAGGIAHDFNNLLTVILGYAELATLFVDNPEKTKEALQTSLKAGDQARQLVQQILTFSRKQSQESAPINVVPIIKEALKLVRASLPSTIEIRQEIDDHAGSIVANASHIHQLIMNLCTNASHAMEENGGVLTIKVKQLSEEVSQQKLNGPSGIGLTVSDTGTGMDEETRERLFEPYFTTKESDKGTGLGLAVVHGIINQWDAVIELDSELGKGTEFQIYIPAILTESTEDAERTKISYQDKGTVMVVDDETNLTMLGRHMLEHAGYTVITFNDPQIALEEFTKDPAGVDVLVTDYTMPQLTGIQLIDSMRALRPDLAVVLCTGYRVERVEQYMDEGKIDVFLDKPYTVEDIQGAVYTALHPNTDS